jgi:biopolymer transport protein ExbB
MMKQFLTVVCLVCLAVTEPLFATDLNSLETSAKADLEKSLQELSKIRENIGKKKIPLARTIRTQENKLQTLRRQVQNIQKVQDSRTISLESLRSDLKAWRDENVYLSNLLSEYDSNLEQKLNVAERDESIIGQNGANLNTRLQLLDFGLERLRKNIGGNVFEGKAIAEDGNVIKGNFVRFGPLIHFLSEGHDRAGPILEEDGLYAHFLQAPEEQVKQLQALSQGQVATLALDVTGGKATAIKATENSLMGHVSKGGVWIFPILGFALISLVVGVFKFLQIYKMKMPNVAVLHNILSELKAGRQDEARALAQAQPQPMNAMLVKAVDHAQEEKEYVEEVMYETLLEIQPRLEKHLPLIALTAATAPLLGLLGTVTGMIHTFKLITLFGTGDAKSLSSGISEALITTEFGLIVAIPALILHALLSRKSQSILAAMEKYAIIFINGLAAFPVSPPKDPSRSPAPRALEVA